MFSLIVCALVRITLAVPSDGPPAVNPVRLAPLIAGSVDGKRISECVKSLL